MFNNADSVKRNDLTSKFEITLYNYIKILF